MVGSYLTGVYTNKNLSASATTSISRMFPSNFTHSVTPSTQPPSFVLSINNDVPSLFL